MGTLQRLPRIVGKQQTAELTYTGRTFHGKEAESMGLVLKSFATKEEMMKHVQTTAEQIASKSPITVR
jgi:enoyl-CoA hydratase/carnithine racemase